MAFRVHFLFFSFLTWIYVFECMQIIPERAGVTYDNPKYIENSMINVRRYSRRSPYYLNLWGYLKHTWGDNVTVEINILQFLHNEYRKSFVRFTRRLCDLINNEPFAGGALKKAGVVCPVKPGLHKVMNVTAPTENFPNVFPFEKGRIDFNVTITDTAEIVVQLSVEATFKQKIRNT